MCPLKTLTLDDNIHKLSQKNYLKFFGLQKITTAEDYAGRVQWIPTLSFPEQKTF